MKTCIKCGVEKDNDQFYLRSNHKSKMKLCKDCHKKEVANYRKRNPGKNREYVFVFKKKQEIESIVEYLSNLDETL